MRTHDEYVFECLCGAELRTPTPTIVCPQCGLAITVDWHPIYATPRQLARARLAALGFLEQERKEKQP